MIKRKGEIHDQVIEMRAQKLKEISDSRRGFVENYMQGTISYINAMNRTADASKKMQDLKIHS